MKRVKQIIGILLILAAAAGLVYWETAGREEFMTEKVLAAKVDIPKGTAVSGALFTTVSVMPENMLKGTLTEKDLPGIEGKVAAQPILVNQQIAASFFKERGREVAKNYAPYVIKGDWIDSRSSSLRKGDAIRIYSMDGTFHLGDYEVMFVKDEEEQEVTDFVIGGNGDFVPTVEEEKEIGDRIKGSGIIHHLEILTSLEEYQKILAFIKDTGQTLLIVQKGEAA